MVDEQQYEWKHDDEVQFVKKGGCHDHGGTFPDSDSFFMHEKDRQAGSPDGGGSYGRGEFPEEYDPDGLNPV